MLLWGNPSAGQRGLASLPLVGGSYARVGIALYGVLSTREELASCPVALKPVLSLKARVAQVKEVSPGETSGVRTGVAKLPGGCALPSSPLATQTECPGHFPMAGHGAASPPEGAHCGGGLHGPVDGRYHENPPNIPRRHCHPFGKGWGGENHDLRYGRGSGHDHQRNSKPAGRPFRTYPNKNRHPQVLALPYVRFTFPNIT